MKRLTDLGFIKVGNWIITNGRIQLNLISNHDTSNVLYSFVSNGNVLYIGKTTDPLKKRLYGYKKPGSDQKTNIRVNKCIHALLSDGKSLDILMLEDKGLLKYCNYKISLAAGLEDTLVYEFNPPWNYTGKNKKSRPHIKQLRPSIESVMPNHRNSIDSNTFEVTLGTTYYNLGFFNVKREYSNLFEENQTPIEIRLGDDLSNVIFGHINRTCNENGTPRIFGGIPLSFWIQNNFMLGDKMRVKILSPTTIKLEK
jgi:hypothetical protein